MDRWGNVASLEVQEISVALNMEDTVLRLYEKISWMESQLFQAYVQVNILRSENLILKEKHGEEVKVLQEELKMGRIMVDKLVTEQNEATCKFCIKMSKLDLDAIF
ncbi:hypothetical protein KFL_001050250 [Klebsormidium nitens]|uniref:Uncharacterized protein n=1 Tax=Klebsormidium nitens TaxID=105231 RepID=A0A1Y1HWV1_KLENI|nr:hypothetical protein KFL_001050250 [Klebsormidium nitens]|eukprot:GAQ82262.1 hypothetical protein KFL_001050250 [Klebsormidium nitens]